MIGIMDLNTGLVVKRKTYLLAAYTKRDNNSFFVVVPELYAEKFMLNI